ncbi:MAG TPA: metal-dependent transcriptional regulator [Flavobacteriaceae bacterium]|nr:metal-dependent transcriptional regulator [Flavobacteriaceae bacterium]
MATLSEENYLKAIFHLENKFEQGANTNALAEKMETKPSSVTDMLKKLSQKKLVDYKKYQGAKLSKKGKEKALEIIRKHRLWEVFLVEKLNFSWDEVHDVAEQLEHVQSRKLTLELDRFLGHPKRDPHGDPIPDAEGNFDFNDRMLLSELEEGANGIFSGVKDSSASFLQYLDKQEITLGKEIAVLERENFDHSIRIKMDGKTKHISALAANNIFIKTS